MGFYEIWFIFTVFGRHLYELLDMICASLLSVATIHRSSDELAAMGVFPFFIEILICFV